MPHSKKITRIVNISAEYKEACWLIKQAIFYEDGSSNYAFEQVPHPKENFEPPVFIR